MRVIALLLFISVSSHAVCLPTPLGNNGYKTICGVEIDLNDDGLPDLVGRDINTENRLFMALRQSASQGRVSGYSISHRRGVTPQGTYVSGHKLYSINLNSEFLDHRPLSSRELGEEHLIFHDQSGKGNQLLLFLKSTLVRSLGPLKAVDPAKKITIPAPRGAANCTIFFSLDEIHHEGFSGDWRGSCSGAQLENIHYRFVEGGLQIVP